MKFNFLIFLSFVMIFSACGGGKPSRAGEAAHPLSSRTGAEAAVLKEQEVNLEQLFRSLDDLAQLERAGSWLQGMALAESGFRESAGDYSGAVAAAYKELAFAYGKGMIQKEELEKGLLNLLTIKGNEIVGLATNAVLAFSREQWETASIGLGILFDETEEPDSFSRWMILVCALEQNREDRRAGAAYKAIRARYAQFPEYWYRGAKAFSGIAAAEYAENCVNSAPQGPFADECRNMLAAFSGLKNEDGTALRTKTEIETIITFSVNNGNPELLDSLLPLIGLPDNPYTVYAVGALRALNSVPKFNDYFNKQAVVSKGRLAERFSYICRG